MGMFTGSFPDTSNWNSLGHLVVEGVEFTGTIPDSVAGNGQLTHLTIGNMALNGTISSTFFEGFSSLKTLIIYDLDNLTLANGTIPSSIFDLHTLTHLEITGMVSLNSTIPTEIGLLSNLNVLKLKNNNHSGPIPAEIVNLTALHSLDLGDNSLSGDISDDIWQFLCDSDDRSIWPAHKIRIVPNDFTSPVHSCVDHNTLPKFNGFHNITGLGYPTTSPTMFPTASPTTTAPTMSPTNATVNVTSAPTVASNVTSNSTSAPTVASNTTTNAPTMGPTMSPVTPAPTKSPVTPAPTSPVTGTPTASPTAVTLSPGVTPQFSLALFTMVFATISALIF